MREVSAALFHEGGSYMKPADRLIDHLTSVVSKRYAPKNNIARQLIPRMPKSATGEKALVPIRLYLRPSTP